MVSWKEVFLGVLFSLIVGFFIGYSIPNYKEYEYKNKITNLQNKIELLENNNKVLEEKVKRFEHYQVDITKVLLSPDWSKNDVLLEEELFKKILQQQVDLYILCKDLKDNVYSNKEFEDRMEKEYKNGLKKVNEWLRQPDENSRKEYYLKNENEIKKGIFYVVYKLSKYFFDNFSGYENFADTVMGLERIDYLILYGLENK